MKAAILSDIHGNLEAFISALEECKRLGVDHIYHLGDLVGYGADPEECVRLAIRENISGVQGNHDAVGAGESTGDGFNPAALFAAQWTYRILSGDARLHLGNLPEILRVEDLLLCHGAPSDRDAYLLDPLDIQWEKEKGSVPEGVCVVFFGHTHKKAGYFLEIGPKGENITGKPRVIRFGRNAVVDTNGRDLCFLNPGSVGQPRDGHIDGSFLVFDTNEKTGEFVRFSYDVRKAQRKILSAGLPETLADRLVPRTKGMYW